MACGCETYTCIEVFINPCSTGVELPVEATADGTITAMVEFNGMWKNTQVEGETGEPIILPVTLFNEDYTHEMRLTEGVTQTCYKVRSMIMIDAPIVEPIPPVTPIEGFVVTVEEVSEDGTSFTNPALTGEVVAIITDQQGLNQAQFTQAGTTITRIDMGGWSVGQILTIFMSI